MSKIKDLLAGNVKRLRKAKNWTQTDLAVESGISFRGIQDIETGKRTPRTETIQALAGALSVDEASLFAEPKEEQSSEMHPQQLASQIAKELDRIRPNSQSQDLSSEELELVGIWRSLPAEGQEIALTVLRDLKATTAVTHKRDAPSRVRKVIR